MLNNDSISPPTPGEVKPQTLLEKALSFKPAKENPLKCSRHVFAEVELAMAYRSDLVTAEAVASALAINRNSVSAWWPAVLMKGIRHGLLEVRWVERLAPPAVDSTEGK